MSRGAGLAPTIWPCLAAALFAFSEYTPSWTLVIRESRSFRSPVEPAVARGSPFSGAVGPFCPSQPCTFLGISVLFGLATFHFPPSVLKAIRPISWDAGIPSPSNWLRHGEYRLRPSRNATPGVAVTFPCRPRCSKLWPSCFYAPEDERLPTRSLTRPVHICRGPPPLSPNFNLPR